MGDVMPPIWAGFECGHLGWCDQDLLVDTRHTPETDMQRHYADVITQGVQTFRDGLPWRHDPAQRIDAVPAGATVIWDLCHFDPPPDPTQHAANCARAFGRIDPPHILAVNEPSMWPMLCGRSRDDAVATAIRMMDRFAVTRPDTVFYSCDPLHDLADETFAATDALVASGRIGVVGINYYPHCTRTPLADILLATQLRYGLPIAITETGWHEGHENNWYFPDIADRAGWLRHVQQEIARSGVQVEGVCWYPWLDMPAWGSAGTAERWPCGFPTSNGTAVPLKVAHAA